MKTKIVYPLVSIVVAIFVTLSFQAGLFSGVKNFFGDTLFNVKPFSQDIVIIAIDNDSINKIGQWPWSREVFAELFTKLNNNPPKVVGLDVIFSEAGNNKLGDFKLANSLDKISYPIIMPAEAETLHLNLNKIEALGVSEVIPLFKEKSIVQSGLVNIIADSDGVIRRFPLKINDNGKIIWNFSYQTLVSGNIDIPHKENLMAVNNIVYASPSRSIRKIPFWRILKDDINLENKIIFIGATAPDLHDDQLTPMNRGVSMSGVEIQANIANQLLNNYRLVDLPIFWSILWIFIAALLPSLIFILTRSSHWDVLVTFILGLGHLFLIVTLFDKGYLVDIFHINLAWLLALLFLLSYKSFIHEKGRKRLKHAFSKYVSKHVLDELLENPQKISLGGEEKELTILFSDIRGFTNLSEKLEPKELFDILNDYFSVMTQKILKNDGVLDKYIGDAIMAFWGAPLVDNNQADHAVQAALEMVKALKIFNKKLKKEKGIEINIGIGIYTGKAMVGNLGSEARFDYTIIGDSVNAASRIEGLTKEYKEFIIIGEETKNQLKKNYKLKTLKETLVKGKKLPLKIYAIEV